MIIRSGHYRHGGAIHSADHDFIVLTMSILFVVTLLYTVLITLYLRNKINRSLDNCLAVTDSSLFQIGTGFLGDIRKLAIVSAMFLRPPNVSETGRHRLGAGQYIPKKIQIHDVGSGGSGGSGHIDDVNHPRFFLAHFPDF